MSTPPMMQVTMPGAEYHVYNDMYSESVKPMAANKYLWIEAGES